MRCSSSVRGDAEALECGGDLFGALLQLVHAAGGGAGFGAERLQVAGGGGGLLAGVDDLAAHDLRAVAQRFHLVGGEARLAFDLAQRLGGGGGGLGGGGGQPGPAFACGERALGGGLERLPRLAPEFFMHGVGGLGFGAHAWRRRWRSRRRDRRR